MMVILVLASSALWMWLGYLIGFERGEAKANRYHIDQRMNRGDAIDDPFRMRLRIAHALMRSATHRFDRHGPYDQRGAAFWDAYTALVEGDMDIPDEVPAGWGDR